VRKETEIHQLESLIRHRVEGILLAPADSESKPLAAIINGLKIPVVTLNHPLRGTHVESVVCNNRGGAKKATEHLIQHGYRRIICLGGDSRLYTIRERQKGYADALRSAGLNPVIESAANSYAEIEELLCMKYIPGKTIDAIFAVRNLITIHAFRSMQSLGLTIPDDIALVGFDDFDLACILRPAITVIGQPVQHIGSHAALLLFKHLQSTHTRSKNGPPRVPTVKTNLVVRSSCGCL